MVTRTGETSWVFWQILPDDVGEPAILVGAYSECISLTQEGRDITISRKAVAEFLKAVKVAAGEKLTR